MSTLKKQGQFREVTMEYLKKHSDGIFWKKTEETLFVYDYPLSIDDPGIIKKGEVFAIGIPENELKKVGPFLTAKSPQSHIGPFLNAVDFLVPDNTEVFAAQDGEIVELVECYSEWGDSPKFRNKLNFVTIKHIHNSERVEFSQYCHLFKNSVFEQGLSLGSRIAREQKIGRVGKSGWTDRDHLHFIVFRKDTDLNNPFGFKSLKIRFV